MSSLNFNFTLLDTGFFRGGQPFHAGEGGYSQLTSHFPPPMSTLQGAIRTALAAAHGWQPGQNDSWPEELGDADSLGRLSFQGPHLLKLNKDNKEGYLFPAPLHLLVKENPGADLEISTAFLTPGEALVCDLGTAVCLPRIRKETKLEGARLSEGFYLTREGYTDVAEGKKPSNKEMFKEEDLWQEEMRIGLKRNTETRTAEDHNLYRIGHIRPEYHLKIGVIVNGLPPKWPNLLQKIVPLGGEGRLAAVEVNPITPDEYQNLLPPCPQLTPSKNGQIRFTLSLITPCSSDNIKQLIRKGPANAPGRCVSACIGKPQLYGGWDLKNEEPRPLLPFLPPGSTWFFEARVEEKTNIEVLHGHCIDDEAAPSYGYGQILIGKWEVD